jgi:hypothetical protein
MQVCAEVWTLVLGIWREEGVRILRWEGVDGSSSTTARGLD